MSRRSDRPAFGLFSTRSSRGGREAARSRQRTWELLEPRTLLTAWYVNSANHGPVHDGTTSATGYATIQDGISAPTTLAGDTILVEDGNGYSETDTVHQSLIVEADMGQSPVDQSSTLGSGTGIDIQALGVSITGLTIEGFQTGVAVAPSATATITGSALSGNDYGVVDDGAATIGGTTSGTADSISGNNNGDGVFVAPSATALILGDSITGNAYAGVEVDGTATIGGATVTPGTGAGNLISGNGSYGVLITGPSATGNLVAGNAIGTDASGTAALGNADGVVIQGGASGNTIGGLTATSGTGAGNLISGNSQQGILITGPGTSDNVIEGDDIGTDYTGTVAVGNAGYGVDIAAGASGNTIGGTDPGAGDVISGNAIAGIAIKGSGTSGNLVAGDLIGTDAAGTSALMNRQFGITIYSTASGNTVGGTVAEARNVISGNKIAGVFLTGAGTTGNAVEDNCIGTNMDGTGAVPNGTYGVVINGGASGNIIGGIGPATRNFISGNTTYGIAIFDSGTDGNLVEGNAIGTDVHGTAALANGQGIIINGTASNNTIGGTAAGAGNVISGNRGFGVVISGSGTTGNLVEGNDIGTDAAGALAIPNARDGVTVRSGAGNNTVGGTVVGAANIIAFNSRDGVSVGLNTTDHISGDSVLGNAIYANGQIGIDLASDGATPNDSQGHSGPDLFQDFPTITSATTINATTTITGTVSGPVNSTLRVELFSDPAADPSGYGQGRVFLGYVMVTTGVGGGGTFTFTASSTVPVGDVVSATATDVNGDTSEFAKDVAVTANTPVALDITISGPLYNPIKRTYTEAVTLTNNLTTTLPGFKFVLEGLPPGVMVAGADGTTVDGSPYFVIAPIGPESSVAFVLTFTKTSPSLFINFTVEIIQTS